MLLIIRLLMNRFWRRIEIKKIKSREAYLKQIRFICLKSISSNLIRGTNNKYSWAKLLVIALLFKISSESCCVFQYSTIVYNFTVSVSILYMQLDLKVLIVCQKTISRYVCKFDSCHNESYVAQLVEQ